MAIFNYFTLSIISMFFFSIGHYVRKMGLSGNNSALWFTVLESLTITIIGAIFIIFSEKKYPSDIKYPIISGIVVSIALFTFLKALSSGPLSIVGTLVNANVIFVVFIGFFFLGENLSNQKILGILFTIIGLFLLKI